MSKEHEPNERTMMSQSWNSLKNKIHKVIWDYNPTFKINIHEPIFVQIKE